MTGAYVHHITVDMHAVVLSQHVTLGLPTTED